MNIYDLEDLLKGTARESIKGKTICFTGKCRTSRADLEVMALQSGAEIRRSVVKKLDFLVRPDGNFFETTEKIKNAQKQGTKIITEMEFLKMVE